MQTVQQNNVERQAAHELSPHESRSQIRPVRMSRIDRRLFLIAALGLHMRRLRSGLPVQGDDIARLIPYADDGKAAIEREERR